MSLQVVLTQIENCKIFEFNGSRYLFKLDFSKSFQENSATEQKFPSVSTAKGTTTEDGDLPFSHALSWQRLYFRREIKYI